MTELSCVIERVVFRNEGNGFAVVDVKAGKRRTRAVGLMPDARSGMLCVLKGAFEVNGRFGEQFVFKDYEEAEPTDAGSMEDFLGSGILRGVGPKTAAIIVARFGDETLSVLEGAPERLLGIPGIGAKKLEQIKESYAERREIADVVLHFVRLGVERATAMKLYRKYGGETVGLVSEDPFRLVREADGIDFKTADRIALRLGLAENSEQRIGAGILYVLANAAAGGNTYLPRERFMEDTSALLGVARDEIEDAALSLVIGGGIQKEKVDGEDAYFLASYYLAEKGVCNGLGRLAAADIKPVRAHIDALISAMETEKGIVLSGEQKQAIEHSLTSGVFVITGGPGTGKTTIIKAVADILAFCDFEIAIAAPTGRAAKRITESTGYEAKTLHRLLEYSADPDSEKMYFGKDSYSPLEIDALIIDEASMIDVLLMHALIDALPSGIRLIIVGDADQLPPVGAGNVLKDILSSERVDFAGLHEIYRQAAESLIVTNAHRINRGEMPIVNEKDGNFFLERKNDEESALKSILDLVRTRLPKYCGEGHTRRDIQVITPVKNRRLGTISLNAELQAVLNPPAPGKSERRHGGRVFRKGDKVMQMKNDYTLSWIDLSSLDKGEGIFNGDIGFIESINEDDDTISVIFDDVRLVKYDEDGFDHIELAYAITVHKSQGSEYPVVVMPMMFVPPMLATRNLLYTAITRGRDLVVLVGSESRLSVMVGNAGSKDRYSALASFLRAYPRT
ncbi:MAG: ATP-dependent RecD-like DNA helicase [Clostridiales Family XIII bacterium]|jgi:exodeoxyribonuclease V alpha subunit|nr:ATP-dependent RecD-like DNA helicase [Clostridiales Family XIII bacterium]